MVYFIVLTVLNYSENMIRTLWTCKCNWRMLLKRLF